MLGLNKRRRLKGIFVQKIGADQLPLKLGEYGMRRQSVLHVIGARLECRQQVAMAPFEILEHIGQLAGRRLQIQSQNTIDDMIRPRLVERDSDPVVRSPA